MLLAFAASMGFWLLYETVLTAAFGRTLGKRWMGIEVVAGDGRRPGLGRAFVRAFFPLALLVVPVLYPLPFVWSLYAEDGRGLHDRLAGTYVRLTRR